MRLFVALAFVCAAHAAEHPLIDDALNGRTKGDVEGKGEFVSSGGWRSQGGRILFDAGRAVEDGYLEISAEGLAAKALSPDKSHLLSGWESPTYNQDLEMGAYWNWRTGTGYAPFKVLASYRGPDLREEKSTPVADSELRARAMHVFRVSWSGGRIEYRLDGALLHAWNFPRMSVRYFAIGSDRKYPAVQPAPVLSRLRVVARDADIPTASRTVERYGVFEESFDAAAAPSNPYKAISATAVIERAYGRRHEVPLFWDGGRTWRVRFSPDVEGVWSWRIQSNDPALNGRTGAFRVEPGKSAGGIQPKVHREHALQREDGSPYYLFGDTNWAAFNDDPAERLDRAALEHYFDKRASQGINWIQGNLLGGSNRAGPPFDDIRSERLNPAYWQEVDSRVRSMNSRGIVAMLFLSWWTRDDSTPGWRAFPSEEARLRYARFVMARYGAYDTAFCVSGEWNKFDGGDPAMMRAIGSEMSRVNANHRLIAIHSNSHADDGSVDRFASEPWMSFGDFKQDYTDIHAGMLASRKYKKPVVHAEYGYFLRDRDGDGIPDKENSRTLEDIRHAAWDIAMSGGYLVNGWGTTYSGGHNDPGPFDPDAPKNAPWDFQAPLIRKLFDTPDFWRFASTDDNLSGTVPRSGDSLDAKVIAPPKVAYWALGWSKGSGGHHVVYVRGHAGPYRYEHKEQGRTKIEVTLFDPRTGQLMPLASQPGGGPVVLTAPDTQDWVFLLHTTGGARRTEEEIKP